MHIFNKATIILLIYLQPSTYNFGMRIDIHDVLNPNIMKNLQVKYRRTKEKALKLMQNGQLSAYFKTLEELDQYKLMLQFINVN